MREIQYHAGEIKQCLKWLGVNPDTGLTAKEAKKRLSRFGPNKILTKKRKTFGVILLSQFRDALVLTLLAATCISALLGEILDAVVIAAIVVLNGILGSFQEYKAEESLEKLEQYIPEQVKVIRDSRETRIKKEDVVPGDIVVLEPGVRVAADARLLESKALQTEEAALTGESLPVSKEAGLVLPEKTPLSERKNMVYAGTMVVRGSGVAVVTATGMATEMGKIAGLLGTAMSQKTPLERRLEHVGQVILVACVSVSFLLGIVGVIRGVPFHEMFLSAVSLAVAAIPEGLPATVTLCLALGVQRMAKKGALVRKLEAIETLGSVTVICTDKTGTLTKNRMEVLEIASYREVAGMDPGSGGAGSQHGSVVKKRLMTKDSLEEAFFGNIKSRSKDFYVGIITAAVLASNARTVQDQNRPIGDDPTETAILEKALDMGVNVEKLDEQFPRLAEKEFTPERRMMSVMVKTKKGALLCVKGASDTIVPLCRGKYYRGQEEPFGPGEVARWERWVEERASRGMRVLAVAVKLNEAGITTKNSPDRVEEADYEEKDLLLLGCLALADPLREEAIKAVEMCRRAGIRPVLVTGDHLRTAESVAREVQILGYNESGMTGSDLDALPPSRLADQIENCSVFARVSPSHKLTIVRALKEKGHVVAMTGDGVNDAPALKEAAVGVAMGLTGTDVAREASAMILTDDNFMSVVRACEEGRAIYENIRKVIMYLLSCNLGEVITMAFSVIAGLPLPLSPIQLLWMNLVTDGLPALALTLDPPDDDLMLRPPRDPRESIFADGLWLRILKRGVFISLATILTFIGYLKYKDPVYASTMAFSVLVTVQLVSAFNLRQVPRDSTVSLFSNFYLVAGVLLSWMMLFVAVQISPFSALFGTTPVSAIEWIMVFLISIIPEALRSGFVLLV